MSDFVNIYCHYRCIVDNTKFWLWFWIYYDFAHIWTWLADENYRGCCPWHGRTGRRIGRQLQLGIVWLKLFPQSKQSNWHSPMDWPKDTHSPTALNKKTFISFLSLSLNSNDTSITCLALIGNACSGCRWRQWSCCWNWRLFLGQIPRNCRHLIYSCSLDGKLENQWLKLLFCSHDNMKICDMQEFSLK